MSVVLAVVIAFGTMWSAAQPASASSSSTSCVGFASCNRAGKGSAGYERVYRTSFWGMNRGHNCTNYVAYRLQKRGISKFTAPGRGTAKYWGAQARAKGITVNRAVPNPGDVAWWAPQGSSFRSGHVAYVESVNVANGTVTVSEDNWGGTFKWRTYRIAQVSGFLKLGSKSKASSSAKSTKGSSAKKTTSSKQKSLSAAPTPKWAGTVRVGKKLTVRPGTWKPGKVTLSYQWLRNGKAISGAKGASYKLKSADRGKRISVKVTGSKAGYTTVSKTSRVSIKVR